MLIEVPIGALIMFFSGSPALDSFFLDWFLGVNLYVGLPWLLAIGLSPILNACALGPALPAIARACDRHR